MPSAEAKRPSAAARTVKGPSAAARTDLGSYRLGNFTVRKFSFGKIPLGSCRLGKALGKVPNRDDFTEFVRSSF